MGLAKSHCWVGMLEMQDHVIGLAFKFIATPESKAMSGAF